jgi:hypothetical protein
MQHQFAEFHSRARQNFNSRVWVENPKKTKSCAFNAKIVDLNERLHVRGQKRMKNDRHKEH